MAKSERIDQVNNFDTEEYLMINSENSIILSKTIILPTDMKFFLSLEKAPTVKS